MEKLFHHLPNLIGKRFVNGDNTGIIESFTNARFGIVLLDNGKVLRRSLADTVKGYFTALMDTEKKSCTPEAVKRLAVSLLERMQTYKAKITDANKYAKELEAAPAPEAAH
jgi:hypothetical protein